MKSNNKRSRKQIVRKRRVRLLLLLIIIPFIIYIVFNTSLFQLKKINIEGNKVLNYDDILRESKLKKGGKIYNINNRIIEKNIEKLAYIKFVNVSKSWPSSININIIEREKALQIERDNKFIMIDREGIILENQNERDKDLIIIKSLQLKTVKVGKCIFDSNNKEIKEFLNFLLDSNLADRIKCVNLQNIDNIIIYMKDDKEIDFGELRDLEYKIKLLNEVIIDLEQKDVEFYKIDMSKGNNSIVLIEENIDE